MPKRQRTDPDGPEGSQDATADEPKSRTSNVAPPAQSKDVWFEDGSIVLQAQNVQFKVYRAILVKRSQGFADALGMPQPADQARLDGCPVVDLPDSAEDLKHFLLALHGDAAYTNVRTILPFPVVEAFIRLGKKYDVPYLRNEGLVRLQICFPAIIEHYEANCLGGGLVYGVQPHNPMGGSETIFKALNLALECGVYTVIPAMYLNLVQNVGVLFEGNGKLNPQIMLACLTGRDKIIQTRHAELYRWLTEIGEVESGCVSQQICRVSGQKMFRKVFSTPVGCDLWSWEVFLRHYSLGNGTVQGPAQELCQHCRENARVRYMASCGSIWNSLPTFFGLPPWQGLRDFAT